MAPPINVAVIASMVVCEIVNFAWYLDVMPWKPDGQRNLISAIIADLVLAMLIDYAMRYHWGVTEWRDAFNIGIFLAGIYISLRGPYLDLTSADTAIKLALDGAHKCVLIIAMAMTQHIAVREGYS